MPGLEHGGRGEVTPAVCIDYAALARQADDVRGDPYTAGMLATPVGSIDEVFRGEGLQPKVTAEAVQAHEVPAALQQSRIAGRFWHRARPDFHVSPEVEAVVGYVRQTQPIPDKPAAKIGAYLAFLSDKAYVNDGIITGEPSSLMRQVEAFVIKTEEVPEAYFEHRRQRNREQGYGDAPISHAARAEAINIIQSDQRQGLREWAEYISSRDSPFPNWFKRYTFNAVTHMGAQHADTSRPGFRKRSADTVAPFPALHRGALARVYDWMSRSAKGEAVTIPEADATAPAAMTIKNALGNGDFATLYGCALQLNERGAITTEQRQQTAGGWKMYAQGSDPDALYNDLQGFGLDWCNATGRSTSAHYINNGDFHVYYTADTDGQCRVPRVAVRMQDGVVGEVRGIETQQELEAPMLPVVIERMQGLPGGEMYMRRAQDMKMLTAIEKRVARDAQAPLTDEELCFLYEIDRQIEGFGYRRDPRIGDIRHTRAGYDMPALKRILKEAINEQLPGAYEGYGSMVMNIAKACGDWRSVEPTMPISGVQELFAAKQQAWQADGVYDYVAEQRLRYGTRYDLVVMPEISLDSEELMVLVEQLGERITGGRVADPHPLFTQHRYTAAQLSGRGDGPIRFLLAAQEPDKDVGSEPQYIGQMMVEALQKRYPTIGLRIPSVLEAVARWHILYARNETEPPLPYQYATSHIDLPPLETGDNAAGVPQTGLFGGGPWLTGTSPTYVGYARFALG